MLVIVNLSYYCQMLIKKSYQLLATTIEQDTIRTQKSNKIIQYEELILICFYPYYRPSGEDGADPRRLQYGYYIETGTG